MPRKVRAVVNKSLRPGVSGMDRNDMRTFYWVSGISGTWTYIDAAYKQHGRIDWFDDIADIGYWWQTAYHNGMSYSLDAAKRSVEQSILRKAAETAARVMDQASHAESDAMAVQASHSDALEDQDVLARADLALAGGRFEARAAIAAN